VKSHEVGRQEAEAVSAVSVSPDALKPAQPEILDRAQLAARWSISVRSIARMIAAGRAPKPFAVGGLLRWRLSSIEDFERKGGRGLLP